MRSEIARFLKSISIHALAKRATIHRFAMAGEAAVISIHALAKRATLFLRVNTIQCIVFQSTPSQRGRLSTATRSSSTCLFQSTPSQRGRLPAINLPLTVNSFQSTPSQRGRQTAARTEECLSCISIHALAKRATSLRVHVLQQRVFQSTPSQRGRRGQNAMITSIQEFQSTPSQRGRQNARQWLLRKKLFQSTPSQRGRHTPSILAFMLITISIHALAKRATDVWRQHRQGNRYFNPRPRKEGDVAS